MISANDITALINELIPKVESCVPAIGEFKVVYSKCKNNNRKLCLTDIMLKVEPVSKHIANSENQRYLTCVGYKLPAPIKSSCIIFKGGKEEIIGLLHEKSLEERLQTIIMGLSDNLIDI